MTLTSISPRLLHQVVASEDNFELDELFSLASFHECALDLGQTPFFDTEDARFAEGLAPLDSLASVGLAVRLKQDLLADGPPNIERLSDRSVRFGVAQAKLSKEYHVEVAVVEALLVQRLTLLQVDDLAEVENCLYDV